MTSVIASRRAGRRGGQLDLAPSGDDPARSALGLGVLRPLYVDGTIAAEAAALHGDLDLPRLPSFPPEVLAAAGLLDGDIWTIRNVLAAYDRTTFPAQRSRSDQPPVAERLPVRSSGFPVANVGEYLGDLAGRGSFGYGWDRIAAVRRRGMDRIGKHAGADPRGTCHSFPQWHCWSSSLDHWKKACRHVVPPVRGTEAV